MMAGISNRTMVARLKAWLIDEALPLWARAGFDEAGGHFIERLDVDGRPLRQVPQRAMVQARQIYVFAHAALLGWYPQGRGMALAAMEQLIARYHAVDGRPGFVFSLNADGGIHDARRDLYTHAFVLLALAWAYRLNADARYLDLARGMLDELDRDFSAQAGGYESEAPARGDGLRQNPHMHLFEALLVWFAATQDARFLTRAESIRKLLALHMVDPATGALREYFDAAWQPAPGEKGRICEPGHHHEWCWLLGEYARLSGAAADPLGAALFTFANRTGFDGDGFVVDEVRDDGLVLKSSRRIWPQTEAIKSHALAFEAGDLQAAPRAMHLIEGLMQSFLGQPIAGGWIDHVSADGAPLVDTMPASSLYHVFLAATEADRVWGMRPQRAVAPVARRPAAFLDRDGVLNVDHGYVFRPEDIALMPGAAEAVRKLNDEGFFVIVVTNQSGIARGYYTLADAQRCNSALEKLLAQAGARIDAFYLSPYHSEGIVPEYAIEHEDRKPGPGMILRAMAQWPVAKDLSFLIGDKESDLEAARRAGLPGYAYRGGGLDELVGDILAKRVKS